MPQKDCKIRLKPDFNADSQPDVIYVSLKNQEEVCFRCDSGEASIEFRDSPFASDVFVAPEGGAVLTGPVVCGEIGRRYKFRIIGKRKGENRHWFGDPEVQVEP